MLVRLREDVGCWVVLKSKTFRVFIYAPVKMDTRGAARQDFLIRSLTVSQGKTMKNLCWEITFLREYGRDNFVLLSVQKP